LTRAIRLCKRCGLELSDIGIRTKPKIYCPLCKEISRMERLTWRQNGIKA